MDRIDAPLDGPAPDDWLTPLRDLFEICGDTPSCKRLRFDDFTAQALIMRARREPIVEYHHEPTGRLLYLDRDGATYRFESPRRLVEISLASALRVLQPRFDPPPSVRPDGRPALRLIHGGAEP